jgi:hypothetical protein
LKAISFPELVVYSRRYGKKAGGATEHNRKSGNSVGGTSKCPIHVRSFQRLRQRRSLQRIRRPVSTVEAKHSDYKELISTSVYGSCDSQLAGSKDRSKDRLHGLILTRRCRKQASKPFSNSNTASTR